MIRSARHHSARLLALLLALAASEAASQTIWQEGERPVWSTMNRHPGWYDKVKKDLLSGGDWLSNSSEHKEGEAGYAIRVPKPGLYDFWARANPVQAKLDWALDRGQWTPIDLSTGVLDVVNVADDGKPDP